MFTILDTIGSTSVIQLKNIVETDYATIQIKQERTNPGGSIKDRAANYIVAEAERRGWLKPGGTIIESSSGNFGISLAMIGAVKGYKVLILVDPKTTQNNLAILKAYGAEVIVVTEQDDCGSYHKTRIAKANELARKITGSFRPDQCFSLLNREAHYNQIARELLNDCYGQVDMIIAAVSTGGHLGGIARYCKGFLPHIKIVGVDAVGSAVFGGKSKSYKMAGVGLGWTPENIDLKLLDYAFKVPDIDAFHTCRAMAKHEGILSGASSGAIAFIALHFAKKMGSNANILCIFADGGDRYLDTIYSDQWIKEQNLISDWTIPGILQSANEIKPFKIQHKRHNYSDLEKQLDIPQTTIMVNEELRALNFTIPN